MHTTVQHDARSIDFSQVTTGSSERNLICNDPCNGAACARASTCWRSLQYHGTALHCRKEIGFTLLHAISFFLPLDCAIDHAEPGANILGSGIRGFTVVGWDARTFTVKVNCSWLNFGKFHTEVVQEGSAELWRDKWEAAAGFELCCRVDHAP